MDFSYKRKLIDMAERPDSEEARGVELKGKFGLISPMAGQDTVISYFEDFFRIKCQIYFVSMTHPVIDQIFSDKPFQLFLCSIKILIYHFIPDYWCMGIKLSANRT